MAFIDVQYLNMINSVLNFLGLKSKYDSIFDALEEISSCMAVTAEVIFKMLTEGECKLSQANQEKINNKVIFATVLVFVRNVLFSKSINPIFIDLLHTHSIMKINQCFNGIKYDDLDEICFLANSLGKYILDEASLKNGFRFGAIYGCFLLNTEYAKTLDAEITDEKFAKMDTDASTDLALYMAVISAITENLKAVSEIVGSRDFKNVYSRTNFALLGTNLFGSRSSRAGVDYKIE